MPIRRYHQTKLALGSDCTLTIACDQDDDRANRILSELWLRIYRFERQFSRFLPGSELTQFNNKAGMRVAITPDFHDILRAAQHMASETGGLYNPFVLPALQRAGYLGSSVEKYRLDDTPDYTSRSVATPDMLELSSDSARIPFGTALDLGGIGKGYLADLLATDAAGFQLTGYWFSLGGDVTGAGYDEAGNAWEIRIQKAKSPTHTLDHAIKGDPNGFAIATSGTIRHTGTQGKKTWHHIIDPRTGKPATTDILLATIEHQNTAEADVLASCAVMVGTAGVDELLTNHQVLKGHIQSHDGTVTTWAPAKHAPKTLETARVS